MTIESMFLTEAELVAYTGGLTQPAAQARYLRELGFDVTPNRDNKIQLAREAVVRRQLGIKITEAANEPVLRLRTR